MTVYTVSSILSIESGKTVGKIGIWEGEGKRSGVPFPALKTSAVALSRPSRTPNYLRQRNF